MRVLIVEDNIERITRLQAWKPDDMHFVFATSPGTALGLIRRDKGLVYAGVMLDHDLQEQSVCHSEIEFSGTQVANAIIQNFSIDIPVLIHSMNSNRAINMVNMLTNASFSVTRIPMANLTEHRLHDWLSEVRENWDFIKTL